MKTSRTVLLDFVFFVVCMGLAVVAGCYLARYIKVEPYSPIPMFVDDGRPATKENVHGSN